jgi:hypothetical protein
MATPIREACLDDNNELNEFGIEVQEALCKHFKTDVKFDGYFVSYHKIGNRPVHKEAYQVPFIFKIINKYQNDSKVSEQEAIMIKKEQDDYNRNFEQKMSDKFAQTNNLPLSEAIPRPEGKAPDNLSWNYYYNKFM